ncbi:MAG: hypothetical protein AAF628_07040 [Planctomycetota bacterium]
MRPFDGLAVLLFGGLIGSGLAGCAAAIAPSVAPILPLHPSECRAGEPAADVTGESRLQHVRQLTFGGDHRAPAWSTDGSRLLVTRRAEGACDQVYAIDLGSGETLRLSPGAGQALGAAYLLDDRRAVYASTHAAGAACPPATARGDTEARLLPADSDLFATTSGAEAATALTETPGYDAEATVCPVTGRIAFASLRDGDLEIYSMEPDGSDLVRLTDRPGEDRLPRFSPDGTRIALRSGAPQNEAEAGAYQSFLARSTVLPLHVEIAVMDREGGGYQRLTANGGINTAPSFHPDCRRLVFASNHADPSGRDFELVLLDPDNGAQETITAHRGYDGDAVFSPDGRYLAFVSDRYASAPGETNVFVAEWVETPPDP